MPSDFPGHHPEEGRIKDLDKLVGRMLRIEIWGHSTFDTNAYMD